MNKYNEDNDWKHCGYMDLSMEKIGNVSLYVFPGMVQKNSWVTTQIYTISQGEF